MQYQIPQQSDAGLDPRIARSQGAIRGALLAELRAGRAFTSLTISEIAEQAGVTRKTFYARAGSLEQLVEGLVYDLFKEISSRIDDQQLLMPIMRNTLSVAVLQHCQAQKAVLGPLVRQCSASLFMKPLSEVLAEMLDRVTNVNQTSALGSVEQSYLIATMASVLHGVLWVWVERGFSDAPSRIANFTDTLLVEGLQKILRADGPA